MSRQCVLCDEVDELIAHVFFGCNYSRTILQNSLLVIGGIIQIGDTFEEVECGSIGTNLQ